MPELAELNPNNANSHYMLGMILREVGEIDEAIASYRKAVELRPDRAVAHHALGQALQAAGEEEEAERALEEARRLGYGR